jgi:hypothetical protein
LLTLFSAAFLEGCCRTDGCIKSNIIGFAVGGAGLDIAAALALGMGMRTAACMVTG